MKITIIWWDSTLITATSWREAERQLRSSQYTTYPDRASFRRDLRHRAKAWSGSRPEDLEHLTSEAFLRELEDHQMCRVEVEEEEEEEEEEDQPPAVE